MLEIILGLFGCMHAMLYRLVLSTFVYIDSLVKVYSVHTPRQIYIFAIVVTLWYHSLEMLLFECIPLMLILSLSIGLFWC